jgi:type IV pilus assembly protein PilO
MPLKNRNTVILAAALGLLLVITYAYWSLVYSPTNKKIVEDKKTIADLTQKLASAKARASQLTRISAEMASLQQDVAQLEKQLPKSRELPSLLRVVTHRAETAGVNMSQLQPLKPVTKGLYDEIPYNVTLTSSFHALGRFLTAMGKGDRLFAARNVALTANSSKADPTKTVNATFQLIAFKYHEQ